MRSTGYKILGYVVWQDARWYLRWRYRDARRTYRDARRKLAIVGGGAGLLLLGGAVALAALRRGNGAAEGD
jgi:hypothetical protein